MDKAQCTDKGSVLPQGFSFDFIVKTSADRYKNGKLADWQSELGVNEKGI